MSGRFKNLTLSVKIEKDELGDFTKGGPGVTLYFSVTNQTHKNCEVKIQEEYILNTKGIQREKDYYYEGYNFQTDTIVTGAKKIGGYIYIEKYCGKIEDGWKFFLNVVDVTNEVEYKVTFLRNKSQWVVDKLEIAQGDDTISEKTVEKKLRRNIERIIEYEEKMGIRIDGITVDVREKFDGGAVRGEIISATGKKLKQSIVVKAVVYDKDGKVLAAPEKSIYSSNFNGYDTFEMSISGNIKSARKIRVYVRPS